MRTRTIVLLEVGMVLGIFTSAFIVPRSTPLYTFVLIAVSVLVAGNVWIFRVARQNAPVDKYRTGYRAYLAIVLLALAWIWSFLNHRL
jgi:succinate dehydrogenase/fumarate reductase cytochrome b subunit